MILLNAKFLVTRRFYFLSDIPCLTHIFPTSGFFRIVLPNQVVAYECLPQGLLSQKPTIKQLIPEMNQ